MTNVAFDPGAKCPRWEKVLDRLLDGRADLLDYLHKLIGSFLVAGPAKALYFPHGPGDNGKPPDTPAAVIHWGTTGAQRTVAIVDADLRHGVEQETADRGQPEQ